MKALLRRFRLGLILLAAGGACVWWLAANIPSASRPVTTGAPRAPVAATDSAATRRPPLPDLDLQPQAVENRLRQSVQYLASDELAGRGLGGRGIDLAADYIAREFAAAGLRTDLCSKGPFQEFDVSQQLVLAGDNRAEIVGPSGKKTTLELHKNYRPLSWSRTGDFSLPLVFVGYGITAPRHGFDEYAGLDVAGKAVIVLRNEPQQDDPKSVLQGTKQTEHAYVVRKIANAAEHGAQGIILCTESRTVAKRSSQKTVTRVPFDADPLLAFTVRGKMPAQPILVMHCRRSVVEEVVQSARGVSLDELERRIDERLKPQSCDLAGWRIAGQVSMKHRRRSLKNVAACRDGDGKLAEEAIVVGAHYDHLGSGGITSLAPWTASIHHGADDNASGTAALIEVARQLARKNSRDSRRLLFIAWTAEEAGLVGSEEYCSHPLVPLKSTRAMINLDMVGRLRQRRLMVFGAETSKAFSPLVNRLASAYDLAPRFAPAEFAPSDHVSFYERRVPVLHFFTGLHGDYHRPTDTADKLNYDGLRKITGLVADLVAELATAERLEANRRAFDDLTLEPTPPVARTATAYLGVVRDTAHRGPGYAVASAQRGSPAERAGLRAGDVILRLGGEEIREPADLATFVRRRKPDERVVLVIRRGNALLELSAVLGRR